MKPYKLCSRSDLEERTPFGAQYGNLELVIVMDGSTLSVLYGRCLHRGALLSDGSISGASLICGVHGWDYRFDTGVSEYNNEEKLQLFESWIEDDSVFVNAHELEEWLVDNPQPFNEENYQGRFQDPHGTDDEPFVSLISKLASGGPDGIGEHGPVGAMGVSRTELPTWDDLQVITAQLARRPLLDDVDVDTTLIIGKTARKPLALDIPMFVSDMSFGALSEEAKTALALGAEGSGTAIASGEGGMLPAEQSANSRYMFELGTAKFGWNDDVARNVQAFHFKFGQGAKTGTGGHLPGAKVQGKIAEVRDLEPGTDAVSPSTYVDLTSISDLTDFAGHVRELSGGIPIGAKMSGQHIEADLDAAFEVGVDYIIIDGRGGGTGAAPLLFRDNISVPTIPALARARKHIDDSHQDVTLIVTGGLRTHHDYVKALCLGADGIAVANSALQAIGCLGMRACNTNNCPVGIATQRKDLRSRLIVNDAASRLTNFFDASAKLMAVLARACGHNAFNQFTINDLTTYDYDMSRLSGVEYGGVAGR